MVKNATRWLCENSRALERFSGKWVVFSVKNGVVSQNKSMDQALKRSKKIRVARRSYVLHVPSKKELANYVPVIEHGTPQKI